MKQTKRPFPLCILILFIIVLVNVSILIGIIDHKTWTNIEYPEFSDTVIEEIREGKHTEYLSPDGVAHLFFEHFYSDYDKTMTVKCKRKHEVIYSALLKGTNETLSLEIKVTANSINDIDNHYSVWSVVGYR